MRFMAFQLPVALLAAAALLPSAHGSHFRYGHVHWNALSEPEPGKVDVHFYLETAMRLGFLSEEVDANRDWRSGDVYDVNQNKAQDEWVYLEFGDGDREKIMLTITTINESEDWFFATFETHHVYESLGLFNAFYSDCCRLKAEQGLQNNADAPWRLETTVDLTRGIPMASPVGSFLPVVSVATPGVQEIPLSAQPGDGSRVLWSLASFESMAGYQPSNSTDIYNVATISDGGIIRFDTTGFAEGFYSTQITMTNENNPTMTSVLDFFLVLKPVTFLCSKGCENAGGVCGGVDDGDTCGNCGSGSQCLPNKPPEIIAPNLVRRYLGEPLQFNVDFAEQDEDEIEQDTEIVVGSMPAFASFLFSNEIGHGTFSIEAGEVTEPYQTSVCFSANDGVDSGQPKCTLIEFVDKPVVDCFSLYTTPEECATEPLCYWDRRSKDRPAGCYPFEGCDAMGSSKRSCQEHPHCHLIGDGPAGEGLKCIATGQEAQERTDMNPDGDPCRSYSKKACQDGQTDENRCEFDRLNGYCMTPAIHAPHLSPCRHLTNKRECKKAVRNGARCNWFRLHGAESHLDDEDRSGEALPGRCLWMRQPINDLIDPTFITVKNKRGTYSLKHDGVPAGPFDETQYQHGESYHTREVVEA